MNDSFYKVITQAFQKFDVQLVSVDTTQTKYKGYTSGSIFSFGQNVLVTLFKKGESISFIVEVESAAPFQIIDWGSNDSLKEGIYNHINKNIK